MNKGMRINEDYYDAANLKMDGDYKKNTNRWEVVCADGEILPCKNEGAAIIELDRLKQLGRAAIMRKRPKLEKK